MGKYYDSGKLWVEGMKKLEDALLGKDKDLETEADQLINDGFDGLCIEDIIDKDDETMQWLLYQIDEAKYEIKELKAKMLKLKNKLNSQGD